MRTPPIRALAHAVLAAFAALAAVPAGGAELRWHRRVDDAFAAARESGKLLLVDAFAEWCGWCRVLDREVFPSPEFVAVARDFVLLRIDVEDGSEGSELAAEHGAYSLPTLLVLEPSGARVGAVEGYAPATEYVARLKSQLAIRERVLDAYRRTLAGGDVDELRRRAIDFYERRDGERAATLLEKLLASATLPIGEEIWTRVFLADSWRLAGRLDRARAAAAEAERAAARAERIDPELGERLDLLDFWIARAAGACGEAAGALASFERQHPASPYLEEARRALARLRADAGPRCA